MGINWPLLMMQLTITLLTGLHCYRFGRRIEREAAAQRDRVFHQSLNDLCVRHGAPTGAEKIAWLKAKLTELEFYDSRLGECFRDHGFHGGHG